MVPIERLIKSNLALSPSVYTYALSHHVAWSHEHGCTFSASLRSLSLVQVIDFKKSVPCPNYTNVLFPHKIVRTITHPYGPEETDFPGNA